MSQTPVQTSNNADANQPNVDTRQTFSETEIQTLRTAWWSIIENYSNRFGANLFLRLFELYPTYQAFFGFANQPIDSFRDSPKLYAHGINVLYMLNMVFDNLDDLDMVDELLRNLVRSHINRAIEPPMFDHIVAPFEHELRDTLDRWVDANKSKSSPTFDCCVNSYDTITKAFLYVKTRIQQLYHEVDMLSSEVDSDCSDYVY